MLRWTIAVIRATAARFQNATPTIVDIAGVSTICVGVSMIYLPAAVILAGIALLLASDKLRRQ